MSDDSLTVALTALDEEIIAVAQFDVARERLVALIDMRADPDDIWEALGNVHKRLEVIRRTYDHLERLMITAGWSMAEDNLPPALQTRATKFPITKYIWLARAPLS